MKDVIYNLFENSMNLSFEQICLNIIVSAVLGFLIFVSYMERQVRIVADSGIAKKIPQDLWNIIADELAAGIKTGHTKEGFTGAIEKCGELLAEHFPAHSENPNELPDGLVILTED